MFEKPEDVVTRWQAGWNSHDADALAELFTEDADFVNVVGLWWHDRAAIRKAHAYGFAHIFQNSAIVMDRIRTRLIGQDAAVIQARWRVAEQSSHHDKNALSRTGIFTFVCQRFDGGWLAVTAHNTDIVPGAETNIRTTTGMQSVDYRTTMKDNSPEEI